MRQLAEGAHTVPMVYQPTDELVIHQPHSVLEVPIQEILPHSFIAFTIWVMFSQFISKTLGASPHV